MRVNKYMYADSQEYEEYAARHFFRLLPVMRRMSINIHFTLVNNKLHLNLYICSYFTDIEIIA